MSPMLLLGLLSLSLFVPIMSDDDDELDAALPPTDGPQTGGDDPAEPNGDVIDGTDGADTLVAQTNDTLEGGLGDDTLSVADGATGAVLNGGEGADDISLNGTGHTGNGGLGQDNLRVTGSNIANGDEGDDTLTATDRDIDAEVTLNGGGGDDVLIKEDTDENTGAIRAIMNGGNGNDTLETSVRLGNSEESQADALTGGAQGDTFLLNVLDDGGVTVPEGGRIAAVEITDFDGAEDTLVIDPSSLAPEGQRFTVDSTVLDESGDGAFTDVIVTFIEDSTPVTLRLYGVTGLQASDVTFATG